MVPATPRDRPVIEVTPAMVEAGLEAFLSAQDPFDRGLDGKAFVEGLHVALEEQLSEAVREGH